MKHPTPSPFLQKQELEPTSPAQPSHWAVPSHCHSLPPRHLACMSLDQHLRLSECLPPP